MPQLKIQSCKLTTVLTVLLTDTNTRRPISKGVRKSGST